jgi:hypothetical protein
VRSAWPSLLISCKWQKADHDVRSLSQGTALRVSFVHRRAALVVFSNLTQAVCMADAKHSLQGFHCKGDARTSVVGAAPSAHKGPTVTIDPPLEHTLNSKLDVEIIGSSYRYRIVD